MRFCLHVFEEEPAHQEWEATHLLVSCRDDPDSERIWWEDGGVYQNLTFPVQPDFISGQHCWHQKVRVEKPRLEDKYGDVFVDTNRSFHIYKEWVNMTRPPKGDLRRPMWMNRPLRPVPEAYRIQKSEVRSQKSE